MHPHSLIEPARHCSRPAHVSADSKVAMIDLLSSAVRLGRAALQPSGHDVDPKTPPPNKQKTSNHAAVRAVSRAFQGTTSFALSLWDGLTPEDRNRRRVVEERKTLLIFHMKYVRTTPPSRTPTISAPPGHTWLAAAEASLPLPTRCVVPPLSNTNPSASSRPTVSSNGRRPRKNSTCSKETTSGSSTRLRVAVTRT